jgi:WD40 repeat protein
VTSTLRDRQWWLWNLVTGTQHPLLTPPDICQAHTSLIWSPQGTYLLGAWNALDGTIMLRLWSRDGQMLGHMTVDASVVGPVLGTVWHPGEAHVVLLAEKEMVLLDLEATVLQRFPTAVNHDAGWTESTPCRWSPDGSVLAAASGSTVQLWSRTGRALATLPLRAEAVTVTWTPDSTILVTASRSMQMELWTPTGEKVSDVALTNVELGPKSMRIPFTLAWDAQGQYLATALRGRTVHLWTWESPLGYSSL